MKGLNKQQEIKKLANKAAIEPVDEGSIGGGALKKVEEEVASANCYCEV